MRLDVARGNRAKCERFVHDPHLYIEGDVPQATPGQRRVDFCVLAWPPPAEVAASGDLPPRVPCTTSGGRPRDDAQARPTIVQTRRSVFDDLVELAGLVDPGRDLGLARESADDPWSGGDDLLDGDREVGRIPLGELGGRVDAGGLEQIAVLRPDARDPHEIDEVDPLEDELAADPGGLGDPVAVVGFAPAAERSSVVKMPTAASFSACAGPIPSTSSIP